MGTPPERQQGDGPADHPPPPAGPPPEQPPPEAVAVEEVVATQGQVRSLRRWLVVAGVWAVAASAIGLIALFTAQADDEPRPDAASAEDVSRLSDQVERLDGRVGALSDQQDDLSGQIDDNSRRLDDLEGDLSAGRAQSRENADMIQALEDEATDLEQQVAELAAGGGSAAGEAEGGGQGGGNRSP